jgi:hypothetical protein
MGKKLDKVDFGRLDGVGGDGVSRPSIIFLTKNC